MPKKTVHKKQECDHCEVIPGSNPDHSAQISRLNRITGQITGIKKMITNNAYCPDILLQIKATRSALKALEINILAKHIKHCVKNAFDSKKEKNMDEKIMELLQVFKNFGE